MDVNTSSPIFLVIEIKGDKRDEGIKNQDDLQ